MTKTALITGASSGFGLEFAKLFAKDKYNLVLVSRNRKALLDIAQQLENLFQIKVTVFAKDLAKP